jgi:hypothetical protein
MIRVIVNSYKTTCKRLTNTTIKYALILNDSGLCEPPAGQQLRFEKHIENPALPVARSPKSDLMQFLIINYELLAIGNC